MAQHWAALKAGRMVESWAAHSVAWTAESKAAHWAVKWASQTADCLAATSAVTLVLRSAAPRVAWRVAR